MAIGQLTFRAYIREPIRESCVYHGHTPPITSQLPWQWGIFLQLEVPAVPSACPLILDTKEQTARLAIGVCNY